MIRNKNMRKNRVRPPKRLSTLDEVFEATETYKDDSRAIFPAFRLVAPLIFFLTLALVWQTSDVIERFDSNEARWARFVRASASVVKYIGLGELGGEARQKWRELRENFLVALRRDAQGVELDELLVNGEPQNSFSKNDAPSVAPPPSVLPHDETSESEASSASQESKFLAPLPEQGLLMIVGDSFANGYAAQIARLSRDNGWHSLDVGRHSTGLTKKDYYDWPLRVLDMVGANKPNVVVVSIGANDHQDMRVSGRLLRFGSDEWRRVYRVRAKELFANASSGGALVAVLGLPPMRESSYDERVRIIESELRAAAAEHDALFFDAPDVFGVCCSDFKVRSDTSRKRLRADDGIHMTPEGYSIVAKSLLSKLFVKENIDK